MNIRKGTIYYVPDITSESLYHEWYWGDYPENHLHYSRGLFCNTIEEAQAKSKSILELIFPDHYLSEEEQSAMRLDNNVIINRIVEKTIHELIKLGKIEGGV